MLKIKANIAMEKWKQKVGVSQYIVCGNSLHMCSQVCHSPTRYIQYIHQSRCRPSQKRLQRWYNIVTLFIFNPRFAAFKHYKPEWILTSHGFKKWLTKNATLPRSESIVKSLVKTESNCILYFENISLLIL